MHPKYNHTLQQVLAWAQTKPNIQGVLMIGSQARSTHPADEWSDLDLMVLADDPQALSFLTARYHPANGLLEAPCR